MRSTRPWTAFALVAIAQFMVVLDTAIVSVALPVMRTQLGFTNSSLQWVLTAYVLTFGGFLLLGGRAADLFGRRRMLLTGMTAFTAVSLLIGLIANPTAVIVLRGAQGIAAALMSPAALSIVLTTFTEPRQRSRALGLWSMVATGGAAVGLLLGGVLTYAVGWQWNFFINVPIGIVVAVLIARTVPAHARDGRPRRLDLPGAVLVTAGLMSAVFGFSQAPVWGWSNPATLGALAGAVVLLAAFTLCESRSSQPLVELAILRRRNVSGANAMMAAVYGGNLGMFFVLTLWMQRIEHWNAMVTGLAFLPFPVVLGVVSNRVGTLLHRYGYRGFLVGGPALVALGLLRLCFLPLRGSYATTVLPALLVMALGYGASFAPMYAAATDGLPARLAGLGSGLITTAQQTGGALGLAILSGVAASVTAASSGARASALVAGYSAGMLTAVGFTALAIGLAVLVVRRPAATADEDRERAAAHARKAPTAATSERGAG